jgi:hypothetical protein
VQSSRLGKAAGKRKRSVAAKVETRNSDQADRQD